MYLIKDCLKDQAFRNEMTRGRPNWENILLSSVDPFLLDEFKILGSDIYKRFRNKTQVFVSPNDLRIGTRGTHTNDVYALAILIAEELGLNVNLVRAIARGHDVGHPPYGHVAEKFLKKFRRNMSHEIVGPIILQEVECLNLSYETINGILCHSGHPSEDDEIMPEYLVVKLADRISFSLSDFEDVVSLGYLVNQPSCAKFLGRNLQERRMNCFVAIMEESYNQRKLTFKNSNIAIAFQELISWMYEDIYPNLNKMISEDDIQKAYYFICEHFEEYDPVLAFSLLSEAEVQLLLHGKRGSFDNLRMIFSILEKERIYKKEDLQL